MKVKICGLRTEENIKAVADLLPDFMGFIFYDRSPRNVQYILQPQVLEAIPENIIKTGVFVNKAVADIIALANTYGLKALQLHGAEAPEMCTELRNEGFTVIKAFGVDADFDFNIMHPYYKCCDYFLFDTKTPSHGGSGKVFDWNILQKYPFDKPYFLGGGIGFEELAQVLSLSLPYLEVVDMNSRLETAPGVKDIELVKSAIEFIRKTK